MGVYVPLVNLLRVAAILVGFLLFIYTCEQWLIYSNLVEYVEKQGLSSAMSKGIADAKLKLLLLSIFVGTLLLFGFFYKPKKVAPHPKTHVKCPDCREFVLKEATICKHCSCKLIPQ
jgi:hypothetical protein